ncbi:transglutaminaseTgpA domain-containing protein [Olsenella sp. An270]|uniref:transglutaminaseTgpA domain-containing protein n=1 Tax=Olsenella sp. An270 TaxID=1965615 RepID=UPI000B367E2D|nr:transglutaminaseTgpA domain-containing protein [Olsenella sp. An270]OUO59108.1 hypothetical protein B5F73_06605 [Olsenella sp. An270]
MGVRGEKNARPLALTRRGAAQLLIGSGLLAAGLVGGWLAPGAAGIALLASCALGLAEVLLARAVGARAGSALFEASSRAESWVRVDQRGEVVESLSAPGARRGLYRQRSVRVTWSDAFGFWRATRVEPSDRELRVPPVVSPELLRHVAGRPLARIAERTSEQDRTSVRPYEKGDGIRRIAWRQTAHHGELMSFEQTGTDAPPVLVVADAIGAGNGDGLAAALAAVLRGLQRVPDVLLSDGVRVLRSPIQQERFCAAVVGERADGEEAARRAREVTRIAGGGPSRRRVVLVTRDPEGAFARALTRGPLAGSVTVVRATGSAGVAGAHEGTAEKDDAVAEPTQAAAAPARPGAVAELAALLACCALALLAAVSLASMIYEGAWSGIVPTLLVPGAALGSALGALLRRAGARPAVRAGATVLLAVALLVAGAALALWLLDGRVGAVAVEGTEAARLQTVWDEPLRWLRVIVDTGAEQLAGAASGPADETWDILVVLMGSGLAALLACLSASRALRGAAALVPLALAAADQSIMGPAARLGWVGATVALGLMLVWLSGCRRPRVPRALLVTALACALGWGAAAVAPTADFSPWSAGGTRVETLVDLSRDLRSRSNERVLTYDTTSIGPVYLRLGVLDTFDGSTWRFEGRDGTALEDDSPLYWAGRAGGIDGDAWASQLVPYVTTTLAPEEGADPSMPTPPGSATGLLGDDGSLEASGCYLAPVTGASYLDTLLRVAPALEGYDRGRSGPGARALEVPSELPDEVADVVARARSEGAGDAGANLVTQVDAIRWLVSYFTDGSFSYSLDAPGGDEGNLETIGSFLESRSGYCVHYATTFALLARELGVPARVALGYAPSAQRDDAGSYVVTMRELHAWAEVWFDGIGWVGVDVTPAAGAGTSTPEAEETSEGETPTSEPAPEETPTEPVEESPQQDAPREEAEKDDASPLPWRAVVPLGLVALAVAGAAAVLLARRRRTATWQAAWRRICRRAWRSGVRWDKSATEDIIVERICEQLDDDARAAEVRRIARNACLERYG